MNNNFENSRPGANNNEKIKGLVFFRTGITKPIVV
jgi:hypothetical protein